MNARAPLPKVAVFISGRGSGFRNMYLASQDGRLRAKIALLISSSRKAGGLDIAREYGVEAIVFRAAAFDTSEDAEARLLELLQVCGIDYLVLSGYLKLLPPKVVEAYPRRIINIHPALLPKYGGKGMYGHFVHEAVLAAGDTETGVTIHLADEIYDNGEILQQVRVPVKPNDTAESLAARVLEVEHELYPKVLQKLIDGDYDKPHE